MALINEVYVRRSTKSLAVRAKQQISICCKTLCEREVVEEYITQLEERIARLESDLKVLAINTELYRYPPLRDQEDGI